MSSTTAGCTMQGRPSRRRTRLAEPRWRTRHPRHHRFKRPTAHEVGNGQGRPCDGETAGNEMSLPSARLGTQADQTTISAAWHHATGNAGRKTAPMTIIGRLKRARPTRRRQKAWSRFATKPKRRANRHQNCHGKPFAPTKQASSAASRIVVYQAIAGESPAPCEVNLSLRPPSGQWRSL